MLYFRTAFLLVAVFAALPLAAQQLSLSRLFYPNVTLRAETWPGASLPDNRSFGLSRTSALGLIPIQSEVQASFSFRKKLDLRVRHTVLLGQYAQINPTFNDKLQPTNGFKSATLGVIRMQASLRDRLWVYAVGGGLTESNETFFTPQPHLFGGGARMHVLGVQTQILYGAILTYNQKFRAVPVFGVNKRFAKDWRITALVPFQADLNYRVKPWLNFDLIGAYGGYSGGLQELSASNAEKLLRRQNYQQMKFSLAANAHLFSVLNVSVEAGAVGFRKIRTFNSAQENLATESPALGPYVGASVRYITSRSKFSSKMLGKLGLGDGGINW
jgi:hypothetical protein